ncbi:hypothetical protein NDU88_004366 [Pleurodeles waltl]|uniref:Uncharacterized protein n=1 Tax=Pleurodeles waltl TaxID=8319 RepID=A0AAV7SIM4_PLEWA|nr:hypothetical protein NDU88_004366 [Pleurodeles waltl]
MRPDTAEAFVPRGTEAAGNLTRKRVRRYPATPQAPAYGPRLQPKEAASLLPSDRAPTGSGAPRARHTRRSSETARHGLLTKCSVTVHGDTAKSFIVHDVTNSNTSHQYLILIPVEPAYLCMAKTTLLLCDLFNADI